MACRGAASSGSGGPHRGGAARPTRCAQPAGRDPVGGPDRHRRTAGTSNCSCGGRLVSEHRWKVNDVAAEWVSSADSMRIPIMQATAAAGIPVLPPGAAAAAPAVPQAPATPAPSVTETAARTAAAARRDAAAAQSTCCALASAVAAMTEEGSGRYEAVARVVIELMQSRCGNSLPLTHTASVSKAMSFHVFSTCNILHDCRQHGTVQEQTASWLRRTDESLGALSRQSVW